MSPLPAYSAAKVSNFCDSRGLHSRALIEQEMLVDI